MNKADQLYDEFCERAAHVIKIVIFLISVVYISSCERDKLRDYPYRPDQPYTLEINVIPMDDAQVNMNNLNLEVNADYLNRYGIAAKFTLLPSQPLDDDILGKQEPGIGRIFLPREKRDAPNKLNLWVVPGQNMMSGVGGYAVGRYNMVVREWNLYGTTVTHEIGHLLGLSHMKPYWNVMHRIGNRDQRADPKSFVPEQLDTMLLRLNDKVNLSSDAVIYN